MNEPDHLKYGLSLFCELFRIFKYRLVNVKNIKLKKLLIKEMYCIVEGEIGCEN